MQTILIGLDTIINNYASVDLMQGYNYTLEAHITDNYKDMDLTGVTVQLQMQKPDKKFIIQTENIIIEGNKIKATLDKDFTREDGQAKLQVVLFKDNFTFGSWVVKAKIKPSAINDNDGQSKNKVTITEALVNKINEAENTKIELDKSIANGDVATIKGNIDNIKDVEIPKINEQLETKAKKEEVQSVQQQVNNLVLGAVGDGNNPEVIQARGQYATLNERVYANENIPFYLQKDLKHEEVSIKTFQPNTWNNTSANFIGFAILFKAPKMVEKIKGFILSDNDGIAYCQLADESGNEIATSSVNVSANATDYTTFDFGLIDTSIYSNVWVRFYGDGTLIPRRCTTWKNSYFDKTYIPNIEKYVAYKQGNTWIPHNYYNYSIPTEFVSSFFGKRINDIHVGNTPYRFASLKTAIESIKDSSELNQYNVYIHNDIDLYSEFGGDNFFNGLSQSNGFMQGLFLPNYVNLIGVGDISVSYNAPDSLATNINVPCISTINLSYNNKIENLNIYGKNVRYVIHDETNNTFHNLKRTFKNCYIEHLGNKSGTWTSMHTLGCGCGSNCYYEYENCKFINTVAPYLMHNNINQLPTALVFNNCEFVGWKDKGAVSLSGLSGTTEPCYAIFNNCKLSGWIATARDIWNVSGGGNTEIPHMMNQTTDNKIRVLFSDEVKTTRNIASSTITKFTPLMLDGGYLNKIPNGQEHRFYGIALEDTAGGNITTVKYKGYIDITSLNIATADGDKIGIADGILTKVIGSDFIGVVSKQDSSYFLRLN